MVCFYVGCMVHLTFIPQPPPLFCLGNALLHLSYCLLWNRPGHPWKEEWGEMPPLGQKNCFMWKCTDMALGSSGDGGVMGKISRSDLAGLWMSQSGPEVGLTKEWKLSRKTQMVMNCSLCLNSHPQIGLQWVLSSYLSQSEVYRPVILGVICLWALCEHLEKITVFADKCHF